MRTCTCIHSRLRSDAPTGTKDAVTLNKDVFSHIKNTKLLHLSVSGQMQQIRSMDCRRRRQTLSAALCMSSSNIKAQEVAGSDVMGGEHTIKATRSVIANGDQ